MYLWTQGELGLPGRRDRPVFSPCGVLGDGLAGEESPGDPGLDDGDQSQTAATRAERSVLKLNVHLKMANKLIQRLKVNFKMLFCSSKDRSIRTSIATLTPKRMGWGQLLPPYGSERGLRETGRLDTASSEKDPLGAMEAPVLAGEDANAIGII